MPRPDYYGNPAGLTDDIEVVRAIYTAFARRDVEGALAFVSPDCVFEMKGTAERIGRTEPYRGHAGALFRGDFGGLFVDRGLEVLERGFQPRDGVWDDQTYWILTKPQGLKPPAPEADT